MWHKRRGQRRTFGRKRRGREAGGKLRARLLEIEAGRLAIIENYLAINHHIRNVTTSPSDPARYVSRSCHSPLVSAREWIQ